eukprot:comp13435_c0_seq1/m.18572 comp13435_c0_seq1/g.18572  ORF comp13435_c0_seq1/g.18572 comp13435_c0_seq1/m.18572 type:complete len:190 (+) comp13435_c0_seq1:1-570(+)
MKLLTASEHIKIPSDIKIKVESRVVTVTGPRGTLTRDFRHVPCQLTLFHKNKNVLIRCDMHHVNRTQMAAIPSVLAHIKNMITGVTKGFLYKMRFVYAHFPINANITDGGKEVEIRNFLGEKIVRKVKMLPGVTIARSDVKDELVLSGIDVEAVSHCAANIHTISLVRDKDIRKFLDGVYISSRGNISN